jgi:hypothetical protein
MVQLWLVSSRAMSQYRNYKKGLILRVYRMTHRYQFIVRTSLTVVLTTGGQDGTTSGSTTFRGYFIDFNHFSIHLLN